MEEELLHGRVALDEHALGHVHHRGVESDEQRREEREEKILLSVGVRVGGDEVVEDDQEEEGDAEHVGEHGELRVGDHFDFDLAPAAK